MKNIMKLEFKKILSKKDVMLMFILVCFSPLLMALCIVNEVSGINFGGAVSVDSFGILIWSFLKYLFVLYLVPIYVSCSFLGKEIETRSIHIMLSNQKRYVVLCAKGIAYFVTITAFFLLFQLVSVVTYEWLLKGTEYGLEMTAKIQDFIFIYAFQWLEMIFVLALAMVLCSVIKGNAALLLGMVLVILQRLLVNFESIRSFVPYYISDYSSYLTVPQEELMRVNIMSLAVYGVIIAVLVIWIAKIWKKRDF